MIFSPLAKPLSINLITMTIRRVQQTAKQYYPALLCRSQPTSCYVLSFILYVHTEWILIAYCLHLSVQRQDVIISECVCVGGSTRILLPFLADLSLQKSCSVGVCMIEMLFQECLTYFHLSSFCFTARHVTLYEMIDLFFPKVMKKKIKHFYNLFKKDSAVAHNSFRWCQRDDSFFCPTFINVAPDLPVISALRLYRNHIKMFAVSYSLPSTFCILIQIVIIIIKINDNTTRPGPLKWYQYQ